jgi:hypothetical protein
MPSSTETVNYSLAGINQSPISDLDATDAKSQRCKLIYDNALRIVSGKSDFNFGEKRVEISADPDTPISDWAYSYTLPPECIKPQRINGSDAVGLWEINGRKILTDEVSPIILEYLAVETDPNLWSTDFWETFTSYLSSRYAKAFPQDNNKAESQWQEYKDNLGEAVVKNGQSEPAHVPQVPYLTTNIRRY